MNSLVPRDILFNNSSSDKDLATTAREQLLLGAGILYEAVKATLGPRGRNATINHPHRPLHNTKDGVTVAKAVHLKDDYQNTGVKLIREAAIGTGRAVGDGTTTATVLAYNIAKLSDVHLKSGANPISIKRGIDKAISLVIEKLELIAKPISDLKDIKSVALIASNGDEALATVIADVFNLVGVDGSISVENSTNYTTSFSQLPGFHFNTGYADKRFETDREKEVCHLENVAVLMINDPLHGINEIRGILESILLTDAGRNTYGGLVLVAPYLGKEGLAALIYSRIGQKLPICVLSPSKEQFPDLMNDLSMFTDSVVVSEIQGLKIENVDTSCLGFAKKLIVTNKTSTFIGGRGDQELISRLCASLKVKLAADQAPEEKEAISKRLFMLDRDSVIIKIGSNTDLELKETLDRVDDTIHAVRAALEEGIVPGGGFALLWASRQLPSFDEDEETLNEDEALGFDIVRIALTTPAILIMRNAGICEDKITQECLTCEPNSSIGFNSVTEETCNLLDAGIVDPLKVTKTALLDGASAATMLILTETLITYHQHFDIADNFSNLSNGQTSFFM